VHRLHLQLGAIGEAGHNRDDLLPRRAADVGRRLVRVQELREVDAPGKRHELLGALLRAPLGGLEAEARTTTTLWMRAAATPAASASTPATTINAIVRFPAPTP
jgi:hypothetical protein